jgi:DNA replication protein DnaC
MALHGPTGIGKTRMMWLLLKRLHFAGTQFKAIRSTEFAQNAIQQFSDNPEEKARALSELRSLKTVPVLFIDDLGKERATARLETELYELLEERTSRLLPILFTTQLAGQALASMLSRENGEAIVRRLREFCEFIAMKSASVQRAKQRFA